MEDLRISTMTAISSLNSDIHLDYLYHSMDISTNFPFIQHGSLGIKGSSTKTSRKSRKPKQKKTFFNQVTIHVFVEKLVNVKLFNNGKIQMTGLKYEGHGTKVLDRLIPYIKELDSSSEHKILLQHDVTYPDVTYKPLNIVLINSDFDIKYKIKRDILHREIIDAGIYSSYEPCIYPGVNIKYYFNANQETGICSCQNMCSGKGDGLSDGGCKKITVAVFKSGKIIITGARSIEQLELSYHFITKFCNSRRDTIELQ
jgi:TATA-box binding protein (TBP) (component of TFIID and TFIIIB)